ncbi:MAG: glycosyltransferase family 1 protein, partial [Acidobacteria bacterium]
MMARETSSPRIAFVVPQYGLDLGGGLERLCQLIAERMRNAWDIEVLTTCSRDFSTWANYYPAGLAQGTDVRVRRFPVERERDPDSFRRLTDSVLQGSPTREEEEQWIGAQGPDCPALFNYIESHFQDFELFIFFGYLYSTTSLGIWRARGKSVLVPAAHDEPMIRLSVYRDVLRAADFILYSTPEERILVESILGETTRGEIAGVGCEVPELAPEIGIEVPTPYLIYVGRVDHPKGCGELLHFFAHRPPGLSRLNLCLVGHKRMEIPPIEGVYWLGYRSDEEKNHLVSGALALVNPSPYESLSLVLLEGWLCGVPVLVNGRCSVLRGQCQRSGGGLSYIDDETFYQAVRAVYHSPAFRSLLAIRGGRYARQMYSWERVEAAYWKALREVAAALPGSAGILPARGPQASCLLAPPTPSTAPTEQGGRMPSAPVQARCLRSQEERPKLAFVIPWYGKNIP